MPTAALPGQAIDSEIPAPAALAAATHKRHRSKPRNPAVCRPVCDVIESIRVRWLDILVYRP
jgi:hypothetical protein